MGLTCSWHRVWQCETSSGTHTPNGTPYSGKAYVWKWDHKTIFSVLSWITFAALLWGRARFGWRGRRAVRILYAGSGLLFLAYVGSRFVLEVVLRRTV